MRVLGVVGPAILLSVSFNVFAEGQNSSAVSESSGQSASSFSYLYGDFFSGSTDIEATGRGYGVSISASDSLDRKGFRLGLGSKAANGIGYDVYFEGEDVEDFDNSVIGFGASIRKVFLAPGEIQPFLKLGVGFGSTELEDGDGITFQDESRQGYVNFFAGLGIEKRINQDVELHAGLDFGYRSWDDVEVTDGYATVTVEQDDKPRSLYIGLKKQF